MIRWVWDWAISNYKMIIVFLKKEAKDHTYEIVFTSLLILGKVDGNVDG